jgi:hypothetical protein
MEGTQINALQALCSQKLEAHGAFGRVVRIRVFVEPGTFDGVCQSMTRNFLLIAVLLASAQMMGAQNAPAKNVDQLRVRRGVPPALHDEHQEGGACNAQGCVGQTSVRKGRCGGDN